MQYVFIGREYDRGIPAKVVREFAAVCHNDADLYDEVLKRPKGFDVYLIDREMDSESVLANAREWQKNKEVSFEYAEYQRLKAKFEGK